MSFAQLDPGSETEHFRSKGSGVVCGGRCLLPGGPNQTAIKTSQLSNFR